MGLCALTSIAVCPWKASGTGFDLACGTYSILLWQRNPSAFVDKVVRKQCHRGCRNNTEETPFSRCEQTIPCFRAQQKIIISVQSKLKPGSIKSSSVTLLAQESSSLQLPSDTMPFFSSQSLLRCMGRVW